LAVVARAKNIATEANASWENQSFHNYADYAMGGGFRSGLARLRELGLVPREKAQAAPTARPKVPMRRRGADCPVVVLKRGNARGAKGVGHRR
jgi:hypothetical protein